MTAKGVVMSYRASSVEPGRSGAANVAGRVVCEVRVLCTESELIESYRLRHEVYGALGYLQCTNSSQLEIDEFDTSSIPFGAFDPVSDAMIGTLRLVVAEPQTEYECLVRGIVAGLGDPDLADQALRPRRGALPSLASDDIVRQVAAFNTGRFPVHELSRTIVHPAHRGGGVSRGLMEVGLAHAARSCPAVLVGGCLPEHVAMYARYGYAPLPSTGIAYFESVGRLATAIVCRTDRLPPPTCDHVEHLLRSLASGDAEGAVDVGGDSRAPYRVTPCRARRRTMEW